VFKVEMITSQDFVPFSGKLKIWSFHVAVVRGRQWIYKKAWCTCKVVVLLHKPIVLGALGPMAFVHLSYVQTDATLVDATCCVRLHTLLHVVGSCCAKIKTGQTFSYVCMGLYVSRELKQRRRRRRRRRQWNWIGVLSNHIASILTRSISQT